MNCIAIVTADVYVWAQWREAQDDQAIPRTLLILAITLFSLRK